jgi:hypothetical protein
MAGAARGQAEATNEPDDDGFDVVELAGEALRIKPPMDWRSSAIRAMADNNYDLWAQTSLAPESYRVWQSIDPTLRQCEEFFSAWRDRTGQDKGESAAS